MYPRVVALTALTGLLLCSAAVFAAPPKRSVKPATAHGVNKVAAQNDILYVEALNKLSNFEPMHEGKVVGVNSGKLTITGVQDNKPHTFTLTTDTALTCDGKPCQTSDLKVGTKVRVATWTEKKQDAARVEAIQKHSAFDAIHVGRFVSIKNKSLVMSTSDNKGQRSYKLMEKATVTCDGKSVRFDNIKPGMKIRIITESAAPEAITQANAPNAR